MSIENFLNTKMRIGFFLIFLNINFLKCFGKTFIPNVFNMFKSCLNIPSIKIPSLDDEETNLIYFLKINKRW